MVIYRCDRCGWETKDIGCLNLILIIVRSKDATINEPTEELNICSTCLGKLEKYTGTKKNDLSRH